MISIKLIFKKIILQITIIIIVTVTSLLAHFHVIPAPSKLVILLKDSFTEYGVPLVAFCAFFENLAGINVYFPGSIVILVAMSLSAGNPARAVIIWSSYVIPFIMGHHINYFVGYLSKRKADKSQDNTVIIKRYGKIRSLLWFLGTFWHPHFSAVTSLASGELGYSYLEFLMYFMIAGMIWNLFYGISLYYFGGLAEKTANLMPIFYVYVVLWAIWDIRKLIKKGN